ncbi:MAG: IclR family transcriptional regulator [Kiritimatiellae bacterium]|nr:IclR family transcriptional regulator [Kiritimatiellia bacterium]
MKNDNRDDHFVVPGLSRGLHILELLSQNHSRLTQTEIAQSLKLPIASVSRIVNQLEQMGYLRRNEDAKTFHLTLKLLQIGQRAFIDTSVLEISLPVMRQLRDEFHDTAAIGVIHDTSVVVIESIQGIHPFVFVPKPGHTEPIHPTGPGKAIMAWYSKEERDELMSRMTFKRYNARTITSRSAFIKELDRIRERGWALDDAEEYDGVYCIAVPVFDRTGYPIASIWITGPHDRIPASRHPAIAERMIALVSKVSEAIGYRGQPSQTPA